MAQNKPNLHLALPFTVGAVEMIMCQTPFMGAALIGVCTGIGYTVCKSLGTAFVSPHIFRKQENMINEFKTNLCQQKLDSGDIMYSANDDAAPIPEQFKQYREELTHDDIAEHIAIAAYKDPNVMERVRNVSRQVQIAAAIAPLYGIAGGTLLYNVGKDAALAVQHASTETHAPKTDHKITASTYKYTP